MPVHLISCYWIATERGRTGWIWLYSPDFTPYLTWGNGRTRTVNTLCG